MKVPLYLDCDKTGKRLAESIAELLPGIEVVDQSMRYDGYKDFNEFLIAQKQERSPW